MTALFPDLSVTVSQRRWACVLDPILALSEYGLPLVKQLGKVMDLWVVREFWHISTTPTFTGSNLNSPSRRGKKLKARLPRSSDCPTR